MRSKNHRNRRARWVLKVEFDGNSFSLKLQKIKCGFLIAEIPIANFYELQQYRSWRWIPKPSRIPIV